MQEDNVAKKPSVLLTALLYSMVWTATLGGLLYWSITGEIRQSMELASSQTRSFFQEFLMTRFWNTLHGGVYVPITEETQPNPYLKDDPYRDLETISGMKLTKLNPAYMTRQISDVARKKSPVEFHLTALEPINPQNTPDPWEKKALSHLAGREEHYEMVAGPGGVHFRYISPLTIEPLCVDCHHRYGNAIGSQHGGISVSLPAQSFIHSRNRQIWTFTVSYLVIWLAGIAAIVTCSVRMQRDIDERTTLIQKLQESLKEVKKLSGLLPICSSCKNIRDDKGYWNKVEQYISEHADIQFTHGICPDCAEKLYPEFVAKAKK